MMIDGYVAEQIKRNIYDKVTLKLNSPSIVADEIYIALPQNATNGDVIKAVFPNIPLDADDFFVRDMYDDVRFWKDWWNAPYKEGDKE